VKRPEGKFTNHDIDKNKLLVNWTFSVIFSVHVSTSDTGKYRFK
jgi:hypothetical protein